MSEPTLEMSNLHVEFDTYEGTAKVLNGVDLTINPGQTVALVGETGCGKSVTAKSIFGLLPSNSTITNGSITLEGQDLTSLSPKEVHSLRGSSMSMIMQDPMTSLNPTFTVGNQMLDVLKHSGKRKIGFRRMLASRFDDDEELRERAIDMLDQVQLSAPERVFESYPAELSGGMRQRVLIAIALLLEPKFLIADEPKTALDVTTEAKILELLEQLIEDFDTSLLYITHDLGVARKVADEIAVMYSGNIVEKAPADEVFARPMHPYSRGLLDSIPKLATSIGEGIGGDIVDYTDAPSGCRFAPRCEFAEEDCHEEFPVSREPVSGHDVACHFYDGPPSNARHSAEDVGAVDIGQPPWWEDLELETEP